MKQKITSKNLKEVTHLVNKFNNNYMDKYKVSINFSGIEIENTLFTIVFINEIIEYVNTHDLLFHISSDRDNTILRIHTKV